MSLRRRHRRHVIITLQSQVRSTTPSKLEKRTPSARVQSHKYHLKDGCSTRSDDRRRRCFHNEPNSGARSRRRRRARACQYSPSPPARGASFLHEVIHAAVAFELVSLACHRCHPLGYILISSWYAFNISVLTALRLQHHGSGPRTLRPASAEEDSATSFSALCHPRPTPPTATVWALPSRN
jgi:hypothetical protein